MGDNRHGQSSYSSCPTMKQGTNEERGDVAKKGEKI